MSASAVPATARWRPAIAARRRRGRTFLWLCYAATAFGILSLAVLLGDVLVKGAPGLSWDFVTGFPSRLASRSGVLAALVGTFYVALIVVAVAFPVGIGTAVWLEEYARPGALRRILQTNIGNLAGVPSIIYGMLGLAVFVRALALQRSLIAGGLTIAILVLPVVIISSQEALRAVPVSLRHASLALGATRWETLRHHVLPAAAPGILTGTILALSRAVGEAAPIILISSIAFIAFLPDGLLDQFTILPIQIFIWTSKPQEEFHAIAASAIVVLLALLLTLNAAAIVLRDRARRSARW
ncbi:MAG TPA: phosphate ABC transporter permease PstA [Candidatus Limnocylindria bacterium]|nr:phosphate ABC transporter permease PstA [Candidatus Limnocylindria bacterium]